MTEYARCNHDGKPLHPGDAQAIEDFKKMLNVTYTEATIDAEDMEIGMRVRQEGGTVFTVADIKVNVSEDVSGKTYIMNLEVRDTSGHVRWFTPTTKIIYMHGA